MAVMIKTAIIAFIYYIVFANAQQVTIPLNDSSIYTTSISSGDLQHYYFSASAVRSLLALDKRAVPNVYLTLATCSQPVAPSGFQGEVPSLEMYLSTSSENTLPGPGAGSTMVNDSYPGWLGWTNTEEEIWIGVVAPTLTDNWTGNWTYEIAVSTQQWMHPLLQSQNNIPFMTLDDTDQTHALFLLLNNNNNKQASVLIASDIPRELSASSCAVNNHRLSNYSVNITQTTRGGGSMQALVSNLTENTAYTAYYAQPVGSVTGLSEAIYIRTKSDANCRLIYNLEFCNEVAYSVAADPTQDINNITASYDAQAQQLFQPFAVAISQFNCETTQYSLVRNCTDCYNDYKRWLCAVSIPRCTSADEEEDDRAIRAVGVNESRNPWIDQTMAPGAWTELLPCIDLCYRVVQSCPPFMQFRCPKGDLAALQYGYWKKQTGDENRPVCNRVGLDESLLVISRASSAAADRWLLSFIIIALMYIVL